MSASVLEKLFAHGDTFRDASRIKNLGVLRSLLGPAWRGFVKQSAKGTPSSAVISSYPVQFDWTYERNRPELAKLYTAAKQGQWDSDVVLDWNTAVEPVEDPQWLLPDEFVGFNLLPQWATLTRKERTTQKHAYVSWMLSQFLHGEQGALFAAAQVTTAVSGLDSKLYGSSQVVDEGRHVEVFHRYLTTKLEKKYEINDNLYVIVDALMTDSRWDIKFLGMQIMIEGLALGAFGYLRSRATEPLLRELLRYVIGDEARHVHYGVLSLREHYHTQLSDRELRERQDWAFEMSLLLRNRFLLQEFYDEFYAHSMSRKAWNAFVMTCPEMTMFRQRLFKRIVPNLKRCNLLPDRLRRHYDEIGLLAFENLPAAPELTAADLLGD